MIKIHACWREQPYWKINNIDIDFPEFKIFKCDNVTFSDYVNVEDLEVWGHKNYPRGWKRGDFIKFKRE